MFSAIAFLPEQRLLAEKWTSPRPARERLPVSMAAGKAGQVREPLQRAAIQRTGSLTRLIHDCL